MARKNLLKGFKKPKGLEFDKQQSTDSYGKFTASPFETGFGTTIGNCLRRILLSSIQGYAMSAVLITSYDSDGIQHTISSEFENIPNIAEDTLEILNKLKQIRLKLLNEAEQGEFHFEFKGPGAINSKNFAVDGQLEIFGEPFHIMQLMKGAHVSMDIQVDLSRGYVPAEVNEKYVDIVGTIPLDAIYGPVRKVSYAIEPCRVGQRNDYDKLVLEIWTDGTVCPEDVLGEAAKIAKDHFSIFINFSEKDYRSDDDDDDEDGSLKRLLNTSINTLDFTVRAKNCLDMAGIKTLGELSQKTEDEISSMRNVGKMTMTEIHAKLAEYNLRLGMTDFSHLKNTIKASRHKEETDEA